MKTINALRLGIQSIFDKVKVHTNEIPELVGSTGVTESNMLQYMKYIESVTDDLIG